MSIRIMRPAFAAMGIVAAAGILAGGFALRPVMAADGTMRIGPFVVVHCTSSSTCETYSNQGSGVGIEGVNTNKSFGGAGVLGSATMNGVGVYGEGVTNAGVFGESTSDAGIYGEAGGPGWGVYGDGYNGGEGVHGQSSGGDGGDFTTDTGNAVYAYSESGIGLYALSNGSNPGASVGGNTGDGLDVSTEGGLGLNVNDSGPLATGVGGSITGPYAGVEAVSIDYPYIGKNNSQEDVFWVDSSGDVYAYGYEGISPTRHGVAVSYMPRSASPTIEDNGTARLVGGSAVVTLDASFADSIDVSHAYQVMLTPDGDTRGLYVASKSPTSFVVREVQGGRGTLDFDYHIYASTLGHAGTRMVEMSAAQARAIEPKVQTKAPYLPKVAAHERTRPR